MAEKNSHTSSLINLPSLEKNDHDMVVMSDLYESGQSVEVVIKVSHFTQVKLFDFTQFYPSLKK